MKIVPVNASKKYDIVIGKGILKDLGQLVKKSVKSERFAVIADENVGNIYLERVLSLLEKEGFSCSSFVFRAGEASKSPSTLNEIYSFLAREHFTRMDAVVALGGGVTGDMAGYAAATYLRGMEFIQIPTSLLAQVDSSVGGKTAVDIPEGKNLVGAFKQPALVLIDTDVLSTLPRDFLIDGMGEVVKYGMIKSKPLFEQLCRLDIDTISGEIEDIITQCVSIKRDVVEKDEFDRGERELLNFGHTLGHSIEQYYNYTGISHGRAVAKGMELITSLAAKKGLCSEELGSRLSDCLARYELKIEVKPGLGDLKEAVLNDKKRRGGDIDIVICEDVGVSCTRKMPVDEFLSWLED